MYLFQKVHRTLGTFQNVHIHVQQASFCHRVAMSFFHPNVMAIFRWEPLPECGRQILNVGVKCR